MLSGIFNGDHNPLKGNTLLKMKAIMERIKKLTDQYSLDLHAILLDSESAMPEGLFNFISPYVHLNACISFDGIFIRVNEIKRLKIL